MQLVEKFKIKDGLTIEHLRYLSPSLLVLLANLIRVCFKENIPVTLTNIVNEKIPGISQSTTHEEGRAVDISVKGWTPEQIGRIVNEFNDKYKRWGTAPQGKERRVAYYHIGTAPHIHLQVNRYVDTIIDNQQGVKDGITT